ncbi:hypothetical protein AOLI_G00047620 [Acnodon oligacanthus]
MFEIPLSSFTESRVKASAVQGLVVDTSEYLEREEILKRRGAVAGTVPNSRYKWLTHRILIELSKISDILN